MRPSEWGDKPYRPISAYYKSRFGSRIKKIPVSVAEDCPNRRGLKGMQTCVFCDVWGSAAYPQTREQKLVDQIKLAIDRTKARSRNAEHLIYFQAYTNTFVRLQSLRENFEIALSQPGVRGLVVGTRPDCISKGVLDLWNEFHKRAFVSVEIGVQSFNEDQLIFLRRGHTAAQSIEAIQLIARQTDVDLGIHLMFGLPGETDDQIVETAQICSKLPISNVKLHNLHVLKNTPLEKLFNENRFQPISFEDYTRRVILFLQHLSPHIYIHRLAALSSRWDELVAPDWTRHHMKAHQGIIDALNKAHAYQGQFYL